MKLRKIKQNDIWIPKNSYEPGEIAIVLHVGEMRTNKTDWMKSVTWLSIDPGSDKSVYTRSATAFRRLFVHEDDAREYFQSKPKDEKQKAEQ